MSTPRYNFRWCGIDSLMDSLSVHCDNSFGPNTPMQNIVDSCRVWESDNEAGVCHHDGSGRNSPRAVYQVTEDSQ